MIMLPSIIEFRIVLISQDGRFCAGRMLLAVPDVYFKQQIM
jgi:hypothetical protein